MLLVTFKDGVQVEINAQFTHPSDLVVSGAIHQRLLEILQDSEEVVAIRAQTDPNPRAHTRSYDEDE